MRPVQIVTDSTCDLPASLCVENRIRVVPQNVHFGEVVYRDNVDLDSDQFLRLLAKNGDRPKTSQPSAKAFEQTYLRDGANGSSIVSIHLSRKLSGTVRAAELARDAVRSRCEVEVVDSGSVSLGLGLIVLAAAELASAGASAREIVSTIRRLTANVHILFVVDTLDYLQQGGRIGGAQGLIGTLLNIRPMLKIEDGEVRPVERVRTRTKALDRLVEFIELFPELDRLAIVHSNADAEVETLLRRVESIYPRERITISQYGPAIGAHAGPGGLGVVVSQGLIS